MRLLSAQRSEYTRRIRASNPAAAVGLRFERNVVKQLKRQYSNKIEHNAWFKYSEQATSNSAIADRLCAPDILFHIKTGQVIVAEIKYTFVEEAFEKLLRLYCPVVEQALGLPLGFAVPLVIVRNVTPSAPKAQFSIMSALGSDPPLLQWLGHGDIIL